MEDKQYYKILGVTKDATLKEIEKAYRILQKKYKPEKNPGNEVWAEKRRAELIEAYEVLKNPETRLDYDEALKKPGIVTQPGVISIKNSPLPVRPAHVRTPQHRKSPRPVKDEIDAKTQKILEKKKKRRNTIFAITGITTVITVVALVFYLMVYVIPFQRVIIRVDNEAIKMDYFIRRVMMNDGDFWSTLQTIVDETIVSQEGPRFVGEVTPEDINTIMRATAQGSGESISDVEYKNWLRFQLNRSQLTETQFKELFRLTLLQSKIYQQVAAQVPNVAPQVRLGFIVVNDYDEALTAKERIDNGEDFAVLAQELSIDSATKEEGGDIGWTPIELLHTNIRSSIAALNIGECSMPLPLESSGDPYSEVAMSYALVTVIDKNDEMELTDDQHYGLMEMAYEAWINSFRTSKTITFHGINNKHLDSETMSWVFYQVERLRKSITY